MESSETISVVIGVAAVAVAAIAAGYGAWQATIARSAVVQAKEMHLDQMQPYVYVYIRAASHTNQLLSLYVKNSGATVATNVKIRFEPALKLDSNKLGEMIADWSIASVPPGAAFERSLGFGPNVLELNEAAIEVQIQFTGYAEKADGLQYVLALQDISQTSASGKTLSDIGESLEKIARSIDRAPMRTMPYQKPPPGF